MTKNSANTKIMLKNHNFPRKSKKRGAVSATAFKKQSGVAKMKKSH